MRKLNLDNKYQYAAKINLDVVMQTLRQIRIDKGLTQKEVAEISGVSISTISKLERGIYPTRLVWFAAMMNVLGMIMIVVPKGEARWVAQNDAPVAGASDVDSISTSV
jgi:predicted transcriptional regulator